MSDLPSESGSTKDGYYSTRTVDSPYNQPIIQRKNYVKNFVHSFKIANLDQDAGEDMALLTDIEKAAKRTSSNTLKKGLKNRHLQMIAIGGSIGTGLFVAVGGALNVGGPGLILILVFITAIMLYCTMQALGELSTTFPNVHGGFNTYCTRFVDPALGFAVSWNYALQWIVLLPLELVALSITINWWDGAKSVNPDVFVLIFYLLIIFINLFGVKGYGELEFYFSIIKVFTIIGFIILGILLICGVAGPNSGFIGAKYWHTPGAFANGFKGVCNVFEIVAFSFLGIESVALCSSETENARKVLSRAIKQVFWRISLFYICTLTIISFLVPYNDARLLGSSSSDLSLSPFVIAINNGGIKLLPSIMNVVILVSVLSVGNTSVFATSRTLAALSDCGQLPKCLGYVDQKGRPIIAVIVTLAVGLLAFLALSDKQAIVFDWLLSISALSAIFTWGLICLTHIRFRAAMASQKRSLDELSFVSSVGVLGSWLGFILNVLVMGVTFWIALYPIGEEPSLEAFFQSYLGFVIFWACYLGYKVWKRDWSLLVKVDKMDIDTGRGEEDIDFIKQEVALEKELIRNRPFYYRLYRAWC